MSDQRDNPFVLRQRYGSQANQRSGCKVEGGCCVTTGLGLRSQISLLALDGAQIDVDELGTERRQYALPNRLSIVDEYRAQRLMPAHEFLKTTIHVMDVEPFPHVQGPTDVICRR